MTFLKLIINSDFRQIVEARVGFEPANEGFADLAINHSGTAPNY